MALRHSYTLLAPVYDMIVGSALNSARQNSLNKVVVDQDDEILINGIGSGLDIPYLKPAQYIGSDITPAMLSRAQERSKDNQTAIQLICTDSQCLPFEDNHFDAVIMHLILAVVPHPEQALMEACRVLKPGGKIYILDKFIRQGQLAPMRRFINIFLRHIATRTDVIFEQVLDHCPTLIKRSDEPALAGGWFRLIECEKQGE